MRAAILAVSEDVYMCNCILCNDDVYILYNSWKNSSTF